MKHKLESRLLGQISIISETQMAPPLSNKDHGIRSHHFMQIDGETVADFILGGASKSPQMGIAAMKLKDAYSLEGKL